jgi:hypothetical protein
VGMMRWEVDGSGFKQELDRLSDVFKDQYSFDVVTWLIPANDKSHHTLMAKALDFVDEFDSEDNLFILYYAGHGSINQDRQSTWSW